MTETIPEYQLKILLGQKYEWMLIQDITIRQLMDFIGHHVSGIEDANQIPISEHLCWILDQMPEITPAMVVHYMVSHALIGSFDYSVKSEPEDPNKPQVNAMMKRELIAECEQRGITYKDAKSRPLRADTLRRLILERYTAEAK